MRAAGLSIFWVIKSVMLAGGILVVFALFIGEFVAPETERTAQVIKTTAKHNEIVLSSRYGIWLREDNRYINVRKIVEKGKLADIFTYDVNEQGHLTLATHVDKGTFLGGNQWRMEGIKQSKIFEEKITAENIDQKQWTTSIDPDLLDVVVVKPENMSLYDLYMYITFLKENNQKSKTFELAFWSRLVNPFITFVMLMVSIPFVVGVKRSAGTGGRLMIGIVIAMLFNIFDKIAGHVGLVYGLNPMIMAILPSVIVFCAASYVVSRAR